MQTKLNVKAITETLNKLNTEGETQPAGPLLRDEVLKVFAIRARDLALAINMSESNLSRFLSGRIDMSVDMAVRIEMVTGVNAKAWLGVQERHNLRVYREQAQLMNQQGDLGTVESRPFKSHSKEDEGQVMAA